MNTALNQRLTISVEEAMSAIGVRKTLFYELLTAGAIRSIRVGRKRLIIVQSLHDWIAKMEELDSVDANGVRNA